MRLNVARRLTREDFDKEDQNLVDKLGSVLNPFLEQMVAGLNKNITVQENIPFEFKSFIVTPDADGIPVDLVQFKTSIKPQGMVVIRASNQTDATFPTSAPFITWSLNNGIITIQHITGIAANLEYQITILIFS